MIATVGLDPVVGYARFSFNIPDLMTGFPLLPVLIGLFAISQIFIQLEAETIGKKIIHSQQKIKNVLPSLKELKRLFKIIIPASFLGTFIGIIPGTGGTMVPPVSLGIPGDIITAVMLGALILIGIRSGPLLFREHIEIINSIFAGMLLANVLILLLGILSVRLFPQILKFQAPFFSPLYILYVFRCLFSEQ